MTETKTKLDPQELPASGFNFMLLGAPGSGKTSSIPTFAKAGLEVFVVFTERGMGNLNKAIKLHNLSPDEVSRIHYTFVSPARGSFSKLSKGAKDILRAPEFGKMDAGNRRDFTQFIEVLEALDSFTDQHGETFEPVEDWGTDRILIIDGLSGLNDMAMALVVGDKPVKTLQDWGVAIDQLDKFIKQAANITCNFGLLAHMEQEKDEITGRMVVTASTLGRKLGTTIGRHFQEVILASKNKGKYQWATTDPRIELKQTYLKESANLAPDGGDIVKGWIESEV